MPDNAATQLVDADLAWRGMEDRRRPVELAAGWAADLRNTTVEFGDLRPRWGVVDPVWNVTLTDLANGLSPTGPEEADWYFAVTGCVPGQTYRYWDNDSGVSANGYINDSTTKGGARITTEPFDFTATATTMYVHAYGPRVSGVNPSIRKRLHPAGLGRWHDPAGEEYLVALYSDSRRDATDPLSVGANDGGTGRAYRVQSGQAAAEIKLNGHDVWGASRLVPCRTGLVLLRQGNARFYFLASDVSTANDTITLNVVADLVNGDKVRVVRVGTAVLLDPLLDTTAYWVSNISTGSGVTVLKLATTLALAKAGVTVIDLTQPATAGQYYLEKLESDAGYGGVGAVPLLMQEARTAAGTVWSVTPAHVNGFKAVATVVSGTLDVSESSSVWNAANHRFVAGQAIQWVEAATSGTYPAAGTTVYCRPTGAHTFTAHASANDALTNTTAYTAAGDLSWTWRNAEFNGMPIVPGREGCYYKNRLLLANQDDNLAISDPLDPLHFTPMDGALTANLGESTPLNALVPLGEDAVVLAKADTVLALEGIMKLTQGYTLAELLHLREVTREFGCLAPLTACPVDGDDGGVAVWMLSRKGVSAVVRNAYGRLSGVRVPVSQPLARKLREVDWAAAGQACGASFENRYLVALPLRGQERAASENNCVLAWNNLTGGWDGWWDGDDLRPVQFARHTVNGQERLCFLHADGRVRYLDPDALTDDVDDAIPHTYTTRGYSCATPARKRWLELELSFDSWYCTYQVDALLEGVNETHVVWAETVTDRTATFHYNSTPDIVNDPEDPLRKDYAILPTDSVLPSDGTIPVLYQSVQRRIPVRLADRSVQFRVTVTRGAMRLKSLVVTGAVQRGTPQPTP